MQNGGVEFKTQNMEPKKLEITSQSSEIDLAVVDDNIVRIESQPAIDGGVELFYYQNTGYSVSYVYCVKRAIGKSLKNTIKNWALGRIVIT